MSSVVAESEVPSRMFQTVPPNPDPRPEALGPNKRTLRSKCVIAVAGIEILRERPPFQRQSLPKQLDLSADGARYPGLTDTSEFRRDHIESSPETFGRSFAYPIHDESSGLCELNGGTPLSKPGSFSNSSLNALVFVALNVFA